LPQIRLVDARIRMTAVAAPSFVLASASPRRADLLTQLGIAFRVLTFEVDERRLPNEAALAYVERIVACKRSAAEQLLAASGAVLDKPQSALEARTHLDRVQGRKHHVSTRFCISAGAGLRAETVTSTVRVQPMTPAQMDAYVASGEGAGKAGGYAIQGGFARHIAHLDGSFSAVMGLPLFEVAAALRALNLVPHGF
jgi:septum formation protein